MAAFWPTMPSINIPQTSTASNYKSPYSADSAAGRLIGNAGQYLAPSQQFSQDVLPYERYAAPQQEVFNQWEQQFMRPEFERFTLDPFQRDYGNRAATTDFFRMGRAPDEYKRQLQQVEQPYYNQLEQARGSYDNMMRKGYEQQIRDYYRSPTTFSNIGL